MGCFKLTYHENLPGHFSVHRKNARSELLVQHNSRVKRNHLGNVLSIISDKVIPHANGTTVDYYLADDLTREERFRIRQSSDYSPFGVQLSGRNFVKSGVVKNSKYGFNGMEMDNEIHPGSNGLATGNSYDFGARMLDPRLGRWLSRDPLEGKYPSMSGYNFVGNSPLIAIDPDGKDILIVTGVKGEEPLKYKPGMNPPEGANDFVVKTISMLNDGFAAEQALLASASSEEERNNIYAPITKIQQESEVGLFIGELNEGSSQYTPWVHAGYNRSGNLGLNVNEGIIVGKESNVIKKGKKLISQDYVIDFDDVSNIHSPFKIFLHEIGHGYSDLIEQLFNQRLAEDPINPNMDNREEEVTSERVDSPNGKQTLGHTAIPFDAENTNDETVTEEKLDKNALQISKKNNTTVKSKEGKVLN